MGLLDDAIREHLELKRRHGADPSEVERQEQEALGPPRRGVPAAEASLAGAVSVETLDEQDEDRSATAFDDEAGPDEDEAPERSAFDEEAEADEDEAPEPSIPAGEPEAPVTPPAPPDEPAQRAEEDTADERPVGLEHSEPPPGAEAPGAGEDVLEETPAFLQETPEHDRLWFEQKPPRDFEF